MTDLPGLPDTPPPGPNGEGEGGVLVRPAEPEEFDAVGDITVAAYREDGVLTGEEDYEPVLADAGRRAQYADLVVAADVVTGELLGTVTFCLHGTAYAELARENEAEFRMLAVSPTAQRRGVGESLVRGCVERARALGAERLVLSTLPDSDAAHRLYERLGFVREPARDWGVSGVWLLAYRLDL